MRRLIEWLRASHRWQHMVGGVAVGAAGAAIAGTWCGVYAAAVAAAALEFKDRQWGGRPDAVDAALTLAGGIVGALLIP